MVMLRLKIIVVVTILSPPVLGSLECMLQDKRHPPIKVPDMVLNCIFAQFKNFPVQNCANYALRVDNWVGSWAMNPPRGGIE